MSRGWVLINSGPTAYFFATALNIASCCPWVISPSATKLRGSKSVAPSAFSGRGWVKNMRRTSAFSASVRLSNSMALLSVTMRAAGNNVHFAASSLSMHTHHGLSPQ